jgi:hypothetical protein
MNFKELVLTSLKAKFPGVSEIIINRIADKLLTTVTTEDAAQAAADEVTIQQVIDAEADRRATEASRTAIGNYEKKHSLKEGKPVQGGGQATQTEPDDKRAGGGTDDTPAWAKALIESNKALADKVAGIEKDKLTGSRKQQLSTVIANLPEALRKPYGRIDLAGMSEDEFAEFLSETTTEVGAMGSDLAAKGAVIKKPGSGGGNSEKGIPKDDAAKVCDTVFQPQKH